MSEINWFPGHMTKALREMENNIRLVDCVCELADARIPYSSRNPALDEILARKPRLIILNRADQADPNLTKRWISYYQGQGFAAIETDCKSGKGVDKFSAAVRALLKERLEALEAKGQAGRPLRAMVVGIPNVGKSSFINRVAGRKAAAASDKPGVTRGKQWVTVTKGLELLDTPGVLWPKFEDRTVGDRLGFIGSVKDTVMDSETMALRLLEVLKRDYGEMLSERYKLKDTDFIGAEPWELLEKIGRKRGMLISGGEIDTERASVMLLDEYRGGKLGKISFESPAEYE